MHGSSLSGLPRRTFLRDCLAALGALGLAACGAERRGVPAAIDLAASSSPAPPVPAPTAGAVGEARAATPGDVGLDILGRPTDRSVTVNVIAAAESDLRIECGTAPGAYSLQTAPQRVKAGEPAEIPLAGLRPNTRYHYRVRSGDVAGPERTFMTQRAPGSTFTFAVQGDSHPERVRTQFDAALYARTLANVAADRPDFFVMIGDDHSVDTLRTVSAATVSALYATQRRYLAAVGAPVFLVNGNHEQAALANLDGTPGNVAVWAQTARNRYFPQPAPDGFYTGDAEPVPHIGLLRDYHAFTWGDALFAVIDPYWHSPIVVDNAFGSDRDTKQGRDQWRITLGEAQYRWLRETLERSSARYKFVFAHHVNGTGRGGVELARTFEWGDAAQFAARRPGWGKPIHQLMADTGVTIFFQGHDHVFVHQQLDGVVYQSLPQPADPNYSLFNADAYRTGTKLPNSGHVRVTVSPGGVTVEYVRSYLASDVGPGRAHGGVAYSYRA